MTANLTDGSSVKGTDCIKILENTNNAKSTGKGKSEENRNLMLALPLFGLIAAGFALRKR